MQFTARQISELLNGTIEGDENVQVGELSKMERRVRCAFCLILNMSPLYMVQKHLL
jgi:UDP-3-O-[3-hydroxymyristoyl] glucosamine N-acyltransferase